MAAAVDGLPWVEKYRPDKIDDVAQQEEVVSALRHSLATGELPNLMFYGPPGTGKTTVALALMKQFFGKGWRERVKEMNASDERGINAVRAQVKTFAQLAVGGSLLEGSKAKFRVVILDEADSMTHDAQAALRRIMEEFVQVTRFIIICNYVSKIIEPLQSRCSKFRFQPVSGDFQRNRLLTICQQEKVKLGPSAIDKLIHLSDGDMRCAVNMLQTAVTFYDEVTEEALVEVNCTVPERQIAALMQSAKTAKSTDEASSSWSASSRVNQVVREVKNFLLDGYSGQQALPRLLDFVARDASVPDLAKAKCAGLFSVADERLTMGCDEELQMVHLFTSLRPVLQAR